MFYLGTEVSHPLLLVTYFENFAWIIPLIEILSAKLSQVLKTEVPIGQ